MFSLFNLPSLVSIQSYLQSNLITIVTYILVLAIIVLLLLNKGISDTVKSFFAAFVFGDFQKMVIGIASVILMIVLVILGISMGYSSTGQVWPPSIGNCPDYWIDTNGDGSNCVNTLNLGKEGTPGVMNFNSSTFAGSNCNKYRWSNNTNIVWDGITYGSDNPCLPKSTPKPWF
jgi:hypothetical protein